MFVKREKCVTLYEDCYGERDSLKLNKIINADGEFTGYYHYTKKIFYDNGKLRAEETRGNDNFEAYYDNEVIYSYVKRKFYKEDGKLYLERSKCFDDEDFYIEYATTYYKDDKNEAEYFISYDGRDSDKPSEVIPTLNGVDVNRLPDYIYKEMEKLGELENEAAEELDSFYVQKAVEHLLNEDRTLS